MVAKGRRSGRWVSQYCKVQAMALADQSDDAPKDDSQDERDHTCRPTDPQAATSSLPKKVEH